MVDVQHGVRIYHWKHGWIPLDHFAAMKKSHGSVRGAQRALDRAHAAGHAHASFAETGTHRGGHGAGSHLRRADGFQPVANEHLRRDKHIVAAFHEDSRQFHLLDLERKHSAVISEEDARKIHLDGHKIIGISKSESGGTQIKVQNMANGRVHRIDAVSDGLSQGRKPIAPKPAAKPATPKAPTAKTHQTVVVSGTPREDKAARFKAAQAQRAKDFQAQHAGEAERHQGIVDGRAEQKAAAARADAKRAQMKAENARKAGDHDETATGTRGAFKAKLDQQFREGKVSLRAYREQLKGYDERHPSQAPAAPKVGDTFVARNVAAARIRGAQAAGAAGNHVEAAELHDKAAVQFDKAHMPIEAQAARDMAEHHRKMAPVRDPLGQHRVAIAGAKNVGDIEGVKANIRQAFLDNKLDREQHNKLQDEAGAQQKLIRARQGAPAGARPLEADLQRRVDAGRLDGAVAHQMNQRRYARQLQIKGNRLRNVDRIQEHRAHVEATQNIQEAHRQILLRQIDAKLGRPNVPAARAARPAAGAHNGQMNAADAAAQAQHFGNGGGIMNAHPNGLMDYIRANPDRFDVKRFSKNGNVSDSYKVVDKHTGEIAWHKDDGQARYGAVKEKLAGDVGNALGFFEHKVNMDVGADGRANHVFIGNAPGVEGYGERRRGEAVVGEGIRKGSDPASFMRMVMHDYLIANDEDRHYMNFHVVDEGGGKMRAAILDHGRAFGGAHSGFNNAPANADFDRWHKKYVVHSARGWDAKAVARAAYPQDHDASAAYDQIVGRMKQANIEDVIQQAFNAPGVELPAQTQAEWEDLIRGRYAHLVDPKNKAGIIRALKGAR